MQHFLASRIGEDMPIKHLFVEYKNWVERTNPFGGSIGDELATLARQGDHFRRIVEPKKGDPVYLLVVLLDAFDNRSAYDLGNAKLVHVLARLNETYLTRKVEPLSFEEQPSVEHILPQNWEEY